MSDLVWIVPLGFGLLVLLYRMMRAAYKIYTAIAGLKRHAGPLAHVKIILWSNTHRPITDRIANLFEGAGWDVNYNSTPQENYNPHYVSGIQIRAFNAELGRVAADAVMMAATEWDVTITVEELKVQHDNPKYPWSKRSVYVTVGYPKS